MNKTLNERARHGLVTSRERVRHYLDVMMLYAAKHPWMRWRSVRFRFDSLKNLKQLIFVRLLFS